LTLFDNCYIPELDMNTIYKGALATTWAAQEKISFNEAERRINTFIKLIEEELENGNNINIYDFGIFSKKIIKARQIKSIGTGEFIILPETKTVNFKPGKGLKRLMNNENNTNTIS
jgi:nucleoid DNA-binding protein